MGSRDGRLTPSDAAIGLRKIARLFPEPAVRKFLHDTADLLQPSLTGLTVDLDRNMAHYNGADIKLKPVEAEILYTLNRGGVIRKTTLFSAVWGIDEPPNARMTLNVHITKLRRKVEPAGLRITCYDKQGWELICEPSSSS